ncbi:MAG: hypothetical protein QOJ65_290 [Fimbriimonadaceae bacterium]|jgi:hypothetical protein|nr:hypothetical protein [Fimbriimonadaceae bacterium]
MPPSRLIRLLVPALVACAALASPQQRYGTVFFQTRVGSFKMLGVERVPAEGKVEVSFTGTILINGNPKIVPSAGLKREYYSKAHNQQAYHGTGSIVIDGKFDSIQWFGRNLKGKWTGFGVARLVGEFDNNLKTGEYWYVQNPDDIHDWGTQLKTITNPPKPEDVVILPHERGKGK